MKNRLSIILLLISLAGYSQSEPGSISVEGEVSKSLKLTTNHLAKYPQSEVKAKDRDGNEHTFKGTLLSVVLDSAGVTLGKQLRGKNLTKYVLIKAIDGYEVSYSLAEIDPEFTSNPILLTTHVEGNPLPKGKGPFTLVNPGDKRPTRWAREITTIKVIFAKQ